MDSIMSSPIITSCAFTGHRPHKLPWRYNELDSRCLELKQTVVHLITKLVASGITDYCSGMADGADIILSQIVLSLRQNNPIIKLHCILPCEGQADQWPAKSQERYYEILDQADTISFISHSYYDGCMLERNRRLVDSATMLFAIYNGERRGGTAATIRYARKLGRGIIIVNPKTSIVDFEGSIPDSI